MKLLNGLNTDVAAVDQPGGTYRRARNMILDDLAGALATEQAPLLLDSPYLSDERFENMQICGRFNVPGDRIIFGIKANSDVVSNTYHDVATLEQIVEVQEDGTITTLRWDGFGNFQFDPNNPFQGVGYVNAAGELILVWSNGVHKPLYINADTYKSNQEEPLLVFPEAQFPMVRPVKRGNQDESGNILTGAYQFFIAYETVDGTNNLTQYGPAMGQFQVGMGTTSEELRVRTSVKLKFYGLDTQYNFARIYAVREYDGVEYVLYADRISTQGGDVEWAYKGQQLAETDVTLDELTIPSITYRTAGTLTVSDDRLFMANLTTDTVTFEEGQAIANSIDVHWTVDEAGSYAAQYDNIQLLGTAGTDRTDDYTSADYRDLYPNRGATENFLGDPAEGTVSDSDHQGLLGGFMPGEVYALYISFLLKDGSWSQAFTVPAGGDSGDFTSTARSGAASLSASTANIRTSGTFNQLLGGKTGYTENTSEDYGYSPFNDVGLNGDAVRHHLMPTPLQMWQATRTAEGGDDSLTASDFANEWCNQQCGLFFQNVVIPNDVASKVQGYQVFYAKATSDKNRVKAYVPTYRWTHDFTNNQQLRIYDPFLLSEKTAVDGWSMLEVYKGMSYKEQLGHTMQSATIDDYAYLPANVITDVFDNEYREPCLALKADEALTIANDWHAGYPAYVGGYALNMATNSTEYSQHGWNSQIVHDTLTTDFPERTTTAGLIGYNFTSTFGTYLTIGNSSTGNYGEDGRPSKSGSNYGLVYDNNAPGTYYDAVTGASAGSGNLPTGTYLGWGGRMGSFSLLYRNYDNYFLNYAAQDLVPTNDLVRVDGGGTYQSNQVVRGGDVWIAPVVVEMMTDGVGTIGDGQPEAANASTDYNTVLKQSYFTWSRVHPSKNDIRQGVQNWTELVGYANAISVPYNGEDMNQYALGSHWFAQNDNKSAFPTSGTTLEATEFPNRIIRSNKQGYESIEFQWGTFAPADYYDNALAKDAIVNIEDYQGELIIHHGNAIYKTRSKFNMDASGVNVFVGSGDIFQTAPMELVPDDSGYAGLTHFQDTLMCRAGYIWVDRAGGRIFMLGRQLQELSTKGLRNYIRDEFTDLPTTGMQAFSNTVPVINSTGQGGFALGYDPQNERILITKRYAVGSEVDRSGIEILVDGVTLSYSLRHQCFTSMHDYIPYLYAHSYNKLFAYNEAGNAGITTNNGSENQAGVFLINGAAPGTRYLDDRTQDTTNDSCYVDAVFAMGGPVAKVWQNFNWLTRAGNAEGDGVKNETFERARIYNDEAVSTYSTEFRLTDNRWQFNEFRNWKADAHTGSIFQDDGVTFDDDATLIDNTKAWYNVQRFISDYAIIRLETLNTTGNRLYLLDVAATARKAYR